MKNQAQFATNEAGSAAPAMIIRVHLENGSIQSFIQNDETTARKTWNMIDPVKVFTMPRLVIAGDYSKSVFVGSSIARIDFVQHFCPCWEFPEGYLDIVELSEEDFRKNAHLDEPELMPKREQPTSVGDLLVSFLKLEFRNNTPLYLMTEVSTKLPADSLSFMRFLLSKTGLHMRLRGGGIGVINLAQLICYTAYPGVAQVPIDTWTAEPMSREAIPAYQQQDVQA
ncbi:MAG TPA: hypothetical protein VKY92_07790 [Verrucomicrobiae bacterium]|nr:hypothetical protein [Verrucomicrobiae bacterium]